MEAMMTEAPHVPPGVDPTTPTAARIYDWMLRGKNNFPPDQAAGQKILAASPELGDSAFANRGFHQRAAKYIAERGVRQFIDVGSGLPTVGNTHEVVQPIVPDVVVVYVDNDPMVQLHSEDLVSGEEKIAAVLGELREPSSILENPDLTALIDFSQPIGLLLTGVMHFLPDGEDPWGLLRRYMATLPSGSYLSLSHLTDENKPPMNAERFRAVFDNATEHMYFRDKAAVEKFFEGLEIVPPYPGAEPAVTYAGLWGAEDPQLADTDGSRWLYCGVARRP
jgi:S-adenosyl methyltransferase